MILRRNQKYFIARKSLYFLLSGLIIAFGAIASPATLISLVFMALFSLFINNKYINQESVVIPEIIVVLLLFQNFAIGIGAHIGNNDSDRLSLLTQFPTMLIVISYIFVVTRKAIDKNDLLYIIYVVLCLAQMFRIKIPIMSKLPYLRNFVIFYMGYTIGSYYITSNKLLDVFIDFFIKLSIFAGLFGIVGVILGKNLYLSIGTMEVYKAKKYTSFNNGLPGNFTTIFAGRRVNRLASFYYDPVNFSYFMALGTLVALIKNKKIAVFLLICEVMTFGKGGLLILVLAGACLTVQQVSKRISLKLVRRTVISFLIAGVIGLVIIIQKYFPDSFGTANHFYGIYTGTLGILKNPFGYGIGSAGNLFKTAELLKANMEGSETGLINMIYQIGVAPAIIFIYLILNMTRSTLGKYRYYKNKVYLLFSYLPVILLLVSIFQENTITPQCVIPYMLFQGGVNGFFTTSSEAIQ